MRLSVVALALAGLAAQSPQAKGDQILNYAVTASFADGSQLNGTFEVDATTNSPGPSFDLNLYSNHLRNSDPSLYELFSPGNSLDDGQVYNFQVGDNDFANPGSIAFSIYFLDPGGPGVYPAFAPLIPLDANSFGSTDGYVDADGNVHGFGLTSGEVSLTSPEPASMTLLGTGLIAFGGFGLRRRRRRAQNLP